MIVLEGVAPAASHPVVRRQLEDFKRATTFKSEEILVDFKMKYGLPPGNAGRVSSTLLSSLTRACSPGPEAASGQGLTLYSIASRCPQFSLLGKPYAKWPFKDSRKPALTQAFVLSSSRCPVTATGMFRQLRPPCSMASCLAAPQAIQNAWDLLWWANLQARAWVFSHVAQQLQKPG